MSDDNMSETIATVDSTTTDDVSDLQTVSNNTSTLIGLRSICKTVARSPSFERTQNNNQPPKLYWGFLSKGLLYGRQHEMKMLHDAFDRRATPHAKPELILLSGNPGVGKTALARKAFEQPDSNNFILGKCDQLERPDPYSPFVQALTHYINDVITKGPAYVHELKKLIRGPGKGGMGEFSALSVVVPVMNFILGERDQLDNQSTKSTSSTSATLLSLQENSQDRLMSDFQKVFRAISSSEKPLVLVLDDLQWADSTTLNLLKALVSDRTSDGFVVVGTCRIEAKMNRQLSDMLRRLEDGKEVMVTTIEVHNFSLEATNELVADVLQQPLDVCENLSQLLFVPTNGNVFFLVRLLRALEDFGALVPDTQTWLWDDENAKEFTDESLDIMSLIHRQIKRLPMKSQLLLRTCACMGAQTDSILLAQVMMDTYVPEAIISVIEGGCMEQALHRPGFYAFSHDIIQQAAYSLIPESERNISHLMIGRMLMKNMSREATEDQLFLVVNQMSRGIAHLRNQSERDGLATLCLRAGEKATMSSDHHSAVLHYTLGTTLLNSKSWDTQYRLSLDLYSSLAEAEYLAGDSEVMMNFAIREVLTKTKTLRDKIRVYSTQVRSLGSAFQLKEAVDVGVKILAHNGEVFSVKPHLFSMSKDDTKKILKMLKGKADSDVMCLPDMNDPDKLAIMGLLNLLSTYSLMGMPHLFPQFTSRLIKISMDSGLSLLSAQGFVMQGLYLCGSGDVENGYRFGNLALTILERHRGGATGEFRTRILFYGWVSHWRNPLRGTLAPLMLAHRDANEAGDNEYGMIAAHVLSMNAFMAGVSLPDLEARLRNYIILGQGPWMDGAMAQLQLVRKLMGKSLSVEGVEADQAKSDSASAAKDASSSLMQVAVWGLVCAYHFGDYDTASELAKQSQEGDNAVSSSFMVCIQLFYDALTALALGRGSKKRNVHLGTARKALVCLKAVADQSPKNTMHKVYLLEAEFAALNGSLDRALKLYNLSIVVADEEGFKHESAIACELAHATLKEIGQADKALPFLERAVELYTEWGAQAKVKHLRRKYGSVY
jgi:predicted ATPase